MTILAYILIVILLGTEVWCGCRFRQILRCRSEARTQARRAFYRARAYKELAKRRTLKKRREMLFKAIEK